LFCEGIAEVFSFSRAFVEGVGNALLEGVEHEEAEASQQAFEDGGSADDAQPVFW
jgi:hypothetical protein